MNSTITVQNFWKDIKSSVDKALSVNDGVTTDSMLVRAEENIEKLREMTSKLSSMPNLSDYVSESLSNHISYNTKTGIANAYGLMKTDDISIARCIFEPNTKVDFHSHHAKEWLIIYKGSLKVHLKNNNAVLNVGESIIIDPEIPHKVSSEVYTELVAITIPKGKGFPDAP